jgi:hypothetical protein
VLMIACLIMLIMRVIVAASGMSRRRLGGAVGHSAKPLSEHGVFHTLKSLQGQVT